MTDDEYADVKVVIKHLASLMIGDFPRNYWDVENETTKKIIGDKRLILIRELCDEVNEPEWGEDIDDDMNLIMEDGRWFRDWSGGYKLDYSNPAWGRLVHDDPLLICRFIDAIKMSVYPECTHWDINSMKITF